MHLRGITGTLPQHNGGCGSYAGAGASGGPQPFQRPVPTPRAKPVMSAQGVRISRLLQPAELVSHDMLRKVQRQAFGFDQGDYVYRRRVYGQGELFGLDEYRCSWRCRH